MREIISRLLIGIAVSCFFYPFEFTFLPGLNTKMMLGVIGLIIFAFRFNSKEKGEISVNLIVAACLAILFSFLCFLPAIIFETGDESYSTYFLSFFVWIFGAYAICEFIRKKNGIADLKTITYYLVVVAVVQCILAQIINDYVGVRMTVDRIIQQGQDYMHEVSRLYGIGASLDNAGIRFAITLLLCAYFIYENSQEEGHVKELWMLYISFFFITVFGNMIARTTTVGTILGIAYLLVKVTLNVDVDYKLSRFKSVLVLLVLLGAAIPLFIYYYSTNSNLHDQLRFAFEGFFNWVETGQFSTSSTDKLHNNMWIWPKDSVTWWIGTGKFENWAFGTDIGYCRFILYCGLTGFSVFVLFFIFNAYAFARKYDNVKILALFLLALTFIIWIKVSTDIFQIYALFICADAVFKNR